MATRAIWAGTLQFGLVNIPVKLITATHSRDVKFNQLNSKDGARITTKRVSTITGDEVPFDDIVKGYEVSKNAFVVVDDLDLENVAPEKSKVITISAFIDPDEVDSLFIETSYYLAPDDLSAKPYALFVEALRDSGKAAIGKLVLRTKEHLAAVYPRENALVLSTLFFHDEITPVKDLGIPVSPVNAAEKAVALQLIQPLVTTWDPEQYKDEYREKLMEIINAKANGETIVAPAGETPVVSTGDLMAQLTASLEAAKKTA